MVRHEKRQGSRDRLEGGNTPEESSAVSTVILAAPYAVLRPDPLDDPDSSIAVSVGSKGGEAIDAGMALDEAAAPFAWGWNAVSSGFQYELKNR